MLAVTAVTEEARATRTTARRRDANRLVAAIILLNSFDFFGFLCFFGSLKIFYEPKESFSNFFSFRNLSVFLLLFFSPNSAMLP